MTDAPSISIQPMPHQEFFEAVFPTPPIVCGLPLKPLSIGRYRLMARMNCAFVAEEQREAGAGDLLMGVLICSMTCEAFQEMAERGDFQKQVRKWGRRFGFFPPGWLSWPIVGKWLGRKFGAAIAASDRAYLEAQSKLFQKYIVEGAPDISKHFWTESNSNGVAGAHWSQSIEAVLREYQNWTKEEINEEPLTKALWDFYKFQENHGMGRFLTPEEAANLHRELTPEEIKESQESAARLIEYLKKCKEARDGQ